MPLHAAGGGGEAARSQPFDICVQIGATGNAFATALFGGPDVDSVLQYGPAALMIIW